VPAADRGKANLHGAGRPSDRPRRRKRPIRPDDREHRLRVVGGCSIDKRELAQCTNRGQGLRLADSRLRLERNLTYANVGNGADSRLGSRESPVVETGTTA
jgi:hypothetical protein